MSERQVALMYENSPDTLFNLCMQFIVSHLDMYTEPDVRRDCYRLKDDILLPAEICEKFVDIYQKFNNVNDHFASLFRNIFRTHLDCIKIRNSKMSLEAVGWMLEHKPYKVELLQCDNLSQEWLDVISSNSENLVSLKFGPLMYVNPKQNICQQRCIHIEAPKLRRLTIQCRGSVILPIILARSLRHLTHLDLSDFNGSGTTWAIYEFKNLRSLVLHNVVWSVEVVEWISNLRLLRHLDISQANDRMGKYINPNEVLTKLITKLTHLASLDISGTNLAGTGSTAPTSTDDASNAPVRCDIPGLESRVDRPLEFLGLYATHHGACKRHDIPAKVIIGDATEEQVLTAGVIYMERPAMLTRVLNDLYYMFRSTDKYSLYVSRTLCVVLEAMEQHVNEKHIQISGSAILFYVVKGKEKSRLSQKLKRRIITALLNGMEAHLGDDTLMRNGCLTLCQFKIPSDVLFEYERVVRILLNGVADVNQEGFVQRIAIYLLNSLACQVDGNQKRFLGNHGAIVKMLNLIADRLERHVCDDVLEVAWSTMWNVTDETPQNSQYFLDNRGMEYFLDCLKSFPDREELLRNMMGLLGNVAEVADLRPQLMDKLFLTVFYELLDSSSDGIEVSYNAAGVLAHMASDGPAAWTVDTPSRDDVLQRLAAAIDKWDRRAERNINYRSFEPILTLLHIYHTPECQHWAAWALANLTTVYPEKYCALVVEQGGLYLLEKVLHHPTPYPMIKELALMVINNCTYFLEEGCLPPAKVNDVN